MHPSPFIAAYAAVFFAEMIGDRSLYAISSLAARFTPMRVAAGVGAAFAMKMGVAVLVGRKLAELSPSIIAAVSATTFFVTAAVLSMRGRRHDEEETPDASLRRAASISFAAIFFTEWMDIGQVTAAMLVARFGAPLTVWTAATLALFTKAAIALAIAAGLRNRLRLRRDWLRYGACATCTLLGILALLRVD